MSKSAVKKVVTDIDVKRKAVKLVIVHLKKKIEKDFLGSEHIHQWIESMDKILEKPEFETVECIQLRKELNGVIEMVMDEEVRYKLRDSWYSLGKALDKKAKRA